MRYVGYLLVALVVGITATLVLDSFENIAVEKRIRNELEQYIKGAAASFKETAKLPTSSETIRFIKKYSKSSLSDKILAVTNNEPKPNSKEYSFLFTYRDGSERLDYYVLNSFLKAELDILETPELMIGLFITIGVFTLIVLYSEKKKQAARFNQQFEVKHAEFRKVLEEHEALALLGRMVATLAHELKTPLATISNLVQMLPSRYSDEQFLDRFMTLADTELNRSQQLINNLLVYGKEIEIGNREWVAVEPILAALAVKYNVALAAQANPDIDGDRFYLELLFENLVRNSKRAGANSITMLVQHEENDAVIMILMEDDGEGIPEDVDISTLLAPFVTFHSSGAGLGLYLANRIAMAHDGSVILYRLEHGAGVGISLPGKRVRING